MTMPNLIQSTPRSRPYRLYTIAHVPYGHFPRYSEGGPAMCTASALWSKSTNSVSLVLSSWGIAAEAAANPLPVTLNLRWRGSSHELDGTRYATQDDADRAAYEAGATAYMVYEPGSTW
jgi:hypothetical protein